MSKLKCLWLAALVVLSIGITASATLAADSWEVLSRDFPASMEWDEAVGVSVDTENDGSTSWNSSYGLLSVEGVSAVTATRVDRWGVTFVPVAGVTVPPLSTYLFEFTITAPPVTTLTYDTPVSATAPGVVDSFHANFILAKSVTPTSEVRITTDIAKNWIVVSRFPDVQLGTPGEWCRFWVEELAGRVPLVVRGFPDGTYRPGVLVQRDAMAVYMARALKLPTGPYQGVFSDVAQDFWARPWIEALAATEIVVGYPDGTYRPTLVVDRDAMAVYVARGIAGGDAFVPTGPALASFPDVPITYWAYKYIEYAVAHGVVVGYPDGTYRPTEPVDRGQMAVYVWRGFIMPTGTAVILAGPATTSAGDPATLGYVGWSNDSVDPGFAYVGFDAVRLGLNLAYGATPTPTWDVTFELRPGTTPTTAVAASATVSLTAAQITALKSAAMASGDPYAVLSWDLSGESLAPGDYHLVVLIEDENGVMHETGATAEDRQVVVSFS